MSESAPYINGVQTSEDDVTAADDESSAPAHRSGRSSGYLRPISRIAVNPQFLRKLDVINMEHVGPSRIHHHPSAPSPLSTATTKRIAVPTATTKTIAVPTATTKTITVPAATMRTIATPRGTAATAETASLIRRTGTAPAASNRRTPQVQDQSTPPALPPRPAQEGDQQRSPQSWKASRNELSGHRLRRCRRLASSPAAALVAQLLLTASLAGWCWLRLGNSTWIRLTVQSTNHCLTDSGVIKFEQNSWTTGPHFQYLNGKHAVRVLTDGDYRVSANVCFKWQDGPKPQIEVHVNGTSWIRCTFNNMESGAYDCCTLFSVRTLKSGQNVHVADANKSSILCQQNSTSLSLEKR